MRPLCIDGGAAIAAQNRARASQFQMSASQKRTVQLLALFAIPQILAVVGVTIWWTRRQTARR